MAAASLSLHLLATTFWAFFLLGSQRVLSYQCYYPSGEAYPAPDVPCNSSAVAHGGNSPCCGASAMCLDNGLCWGQGVMSRGSCTDKHWGEECTPYCKTTGMAFSLPTRRCWRPLTSANRPDGGSSYLDVLAVRAAAVLLRLQPDKLRDGLRPFLL